MYRAGMTSTEVIGISGEDDFIEYDDGVLCNTVRQGGPLLYT